jgi:hypothetical protein
MDTTGSVHENVTTSIHRLHELDVNAIEHPTIRGDNSIDGFNPSIVPAARQDSAEEIVISTHEFPFPISSTLPRLSISDVTDHIDTREPVRQK